MPLEKTLLIWLDDKGMPPPLCFGPPLRAWSLSGAVRPDDSPVVSTRHFRLERPDMKSIDLWTEQDDRDAQNLEAAQRIMLGKLKRSGAVTG